MFTTFEGRVRTVAPKLSRDNDDNVRRFTQLILACDYDDDMAAGLGDVGKDSLRHLKSGASKSNTILLDSVGVLAEVSGSQGGHKLRMVGVKARASVPSKEGSGPVVALEFAFPTKDEDLLYFVHHYDETVKVSLKREQEKLAGVK